MYAFRHLQCDESSRAGAFDYIYHTIFFYLAIRDGSVAFLPDIPDGLEQLLIRLIRLRSQRSDEGLKHGFTYNSLKIEKGSHSSWLRQQHHQRMYPHWFDRPYSRTK